MKGRTYAYADPPYLGYASNYRRHHPDALDYDQPETHRALIRRLTDEYPDGWALSLTSGNLHALLPMCPPDARIAAWVKPFTAFHVNPAYTWEPVIFRGGRKRRRAEPTVRDHLATNMALRRGLFGAKPEAFCRWVLDLLGYRAGDTLVDLFPGTGVMSRTAALVAEELPLADWRTEPTTAPMWEEVQ